MTSHPPAPEGMPETLTVGDRVIVIETHQAPAWRGREGVVRGVAPVLVRFDSPPPGWEDSHGAWDPKWLRLLPAAPGQGDRLFESGCVFCGGKEVFERSTGHHKGVRYCACVAQPTTSAGVEKIDAEITRRRALTNPESSPLGDGKAAGFEPSVGQWCDGEGSPDADKEYRGVCIRGKFMRYGDESAPKDAIIDFGDGIKRYVRRATLRPAGWPAPATPQSLAKEDARRTSPPLADGESGKAARCCTACGGVAEGGTILVTGRLVCSTCDKMRHAPVPVGQLPRCLDCARPCDDQRTAAVRFTRVGGDTRPLGSVCGRPDCGKAPCRHPRRFHSGMCVQCGHVAPVTGTYVDAGGNSYELGVYAQKAPSESEGEAEDRRRRVERIQAIFNCPHANFDRFNGKCLDCGVSDLEFRLLRTYEPHRRANYGAGGIDKRIVAAHVASSESRASEGKAVSTHPDAWPEGSHDDVSELAATSSWSGR